MLLWCGFFSSLGCAFFPRNRAQSRARAFNYKVTDFCIIFFYHSCLHVCASARCHRMPSHLWMCSVFHHSTRNNQHKHTIYSIGSAVGLLCRTYSSSSRRTLHTLPKMTKIDKAKQREQILYTHTHTPKRVQLKSVQRCNCDLNEFRLLGWRITSQFTSGCDFVSWNVHDSSTTATMPTNHIDISLSVG